MGVNGDWLCFGARLKRGLNKQFLALLCWLKASEVFTWLKATKQLDKCNRGAACRVTTRVHTFTYIYISLPFNHLPVWFRFLLNYTGLVSTAGRQSSDVITATGISTVFPEPSISWSPLCFWCYWSFRLTEDEWCEGTGGRIRFWNIQLCVYEKWWTWTLRQKVRHWSLILPVDM